jgi:hypothetical protein
MKKCSHPIVEERNKRTTKFKLKKNSNKKNLTSYKVYQKMTKILMITNMIWQNNEELHYKVLTSKFQQKKNLEEMNTNSLNH